MVYADLHKGFERKKEKAGGFSGSPAWIGMSNG